MSTTSIVSFAAGVAAPQADVNSDTPSGPAGWLRPVIGRRWLEPCQVAIIATRSTSRRPSFVTPTVERWGCGGVVITPEFMNIPSGVPSFQVKRSALTPPTVAVDERRFCIDVTVSRPTTVLFESTGWRAYSPPGLGTVITWTTSGPCGVKTSWRVYVIPGASEIAGRAGGRHENAREEGGDHDSAQHLTRDEASGSSDGTADRG